MNDKFTKREILSAECMKQHGYRRWMKRLRYQPHLTRMLSIDEQRYKDGSASVGVPRMKLSG